MRVQPFSQKSRTPTVAKEFQIGLYDPAEADLELFCNSWSAGFLGERLYSCRSHVVFLCLRQRRCSCAGEQTLLAPFLEDISFDKAYGRFAPFLFDRQHQQTDELLTTNIAAVLPKIPHSNCCKKVPNRPLRPPQRPIWNTFGTVAVRVFWENGCLCPPRGTEQRFREALP